MYFSITWFILPAKYAFFQKLSHVVSRESIFYCLYKLFWKVGMHFHWLYAIVSINALWSFSEYFNLIHYFFSFWEQLLFCALSHFKLSSTLDFFVCLFYCSHKMQTRFANASTECLHRCVLRQIPPCCLKPVPRLCFFSTCSALDCLIHIVLIDISYKSSPSITAECDNCTAQVGGNCGSPLLLRFPVFVKPLDLSQCVTITAIFLSQQLVRLHSFLCCGEA